MTFYIHKNFRFRLLFVLICMAIGSIMVAMDGPDEAMEKALAQLRAIHCSMVSREIKMGNRGSEVLQLIDKLPISNPMEVYRPQSYQLPNGSVVHNNDRYFFGIPQHSQHCPVSPECYLVQDAVVSRNADVLKAMIVRYGAPVVLTAFAQNGQTTRNCFWNIIKDDGKYGVENTIAMIEVLVELDTTSFRVNLREVDRVTVINALNALDVNNDKALQDRLQLVRTKLFGGNSRVRMLIIPAGVTLSICAVVGCILWYWHSGTHQESDDDDDDLQTAQEQITQHN